MSEQKLYVALKIGKSITREMALGFITVLEHFDKHFAHVSNRNITYKLKDDGDNNELCIMACLTIRGETEALWRENEELKSVVSRITGYTE
jgi:hypothetical protein